MEETNQAVKKYKDGSPQRRMDPFDQVTWALVIIWAGVVLLLDNLGVFSSLGIDFLARMQPWEVIFAGAGLLVLALAAARLLVPSLMGPDSNQFLFGFFLFGIGIGGIVGWDIVGALLLIGLGVGQLLRRNR
jgi:hypothetical protein